MEKASKLCMYLLQSSELGKQTQLFTRCLLAPSCQSAELYLSHGQKQSVSLPSTGSAWGGGGVARREDEKCLIRNRVSSAAPG